MATPTEKPSTSSQDEAGELVAFDVDSTKVTTATPAEAPEEEEEPAAGTEKDTGHFDPRTSRFRFIVLVVVVLLYVATSYAKSTAKTLHKSLLMRRADEPLGPFRDEKYELAFTVHTAPTAFMALVAGVLVGRYGATKSLLAFTVLCLIGQVLCAVGLTAEGEAFWGIFLVGRLLNGLGTGAFRVATNVMMKTWFPDSELATAMSFSRVGDVAALGSESGLSQVTLKQTGSFSLPFFIGAIILAAGCAGVFILTLKPLPRKKKEGEVERNFLGTIAVQLKRVWTETKSFPPVYWNLVAVLFFFDGASTATQSMMLIVLTDQYGIANDTAGLMRPIPKYVAVLGPLIGFVIDRYGKRNFVLITVGNAMIVIILTLFFTEGKIESEDGRLGFVAMILALFGLGHSWFSAVLWPNFGRVVDKKVVSSAYGVASSINALACALVPVVFAEFRANGLIGYFELFLVGMFVIGIAFAVHLWWFFGLLIKSHLRPTTFKTVSTTFDDIKDEIELADRMDAAYEEEQEHIAEGKRRASEEAAAAPEQRVVGAV